MTNSEPQRLRTDSLRLDDSIPHITMPVNSRHNKEKEMLRSLLELLGYVKRPKNWIMAVATRLERSGQGR